MLRSGVLCLNLVFFVNLYYNENMINRISFPGIVITVFFALLLVGAGSCSASPEGDNPPQGPVVVFSTPQQGTTLREPQFTVSGTATDPDSVVQAVYLAVNDGSFGPVSGTETWTTNVQVTAKGEYVLRAYAVNLKGVSGQTNQISITVDTSPVAGIVYPYDQDMVVFTNLLVSGLVSDEDDAVTAVYLSLNSGAYSNVGSGSRWSNYCHVLQNSTNTLRVYAMDEAGNYSTTNQVQFRVDTNAFVFPVQLDGLKEAVWDQAKAFDEPGDDEQENDPKREITAFRVTNDIGYLYLGLEVADLQDDSTVNFGVYIDSDALAGSGDSGNIWSKAIEYHSEGTGHLADFQVFGDVSNNFNQLDFYIWSQSDSQWESVGPGGVGFARSFSSDFIEIRIARSHLKLQTGQVIYLRAFSTGGGYKAVATDVAPVDDDGSYPEALPLGSGATNAIWNPGNSDSAASYTIVQ